MNQKLQKASNSDIFETETSNETSKRCGCTTPEQENGKRFNMMGSEVEEGYICKPKQKDPYKPIMHYKSHLFLCDDERCSGAHKEPVTDKLRDLLKTIELAKGENRIKITRTGCFGACRFRAVGLIYENGSEGLTNNMVWLRNVHQYNEAKWKDLFTCLSEGISVAGKYPEDMIPMKVF